jgi:uncharacterized membrane protein (DUF2068 family)
VFALVSALFTWGDGWVFAQKELTRAWIPLGDLALTVPLSLATAVGLWQGRAWGVRLGLVTSGVYLFGSVLVFVELMWMGELRWRLLLPALTGCTFAVVFLVASGSGGRPHSSPPPRR